MAPKRAAKRTAKPEPEDSEEPVSDEEPKKKRKTTKPKAEKTGATPKKPKKAALTEPETTEEGWTLHPPSLIYRYTEF